MMLTSVSDPPVQASRLAPPRIVREDLPDGSFVLRSTASLQPYERCIGEWLERWARETPDNVFLAEREQGDGARSWRTVTYAQAREAVRRIGQGLLDLRMPEGAPVVALSDNSVNLALLMLGAMHVGRPIAIVSSAYVRMAREYSKLCAILARLKPGLLYAEDGSGVFRTAIDSWGPDCPVFFTQGVTAGARDFSELLSRTPTADVDRAYAAIAPDTVAKLLLTSGSTGAPKVVINTHGMLCANQQMIAQCWRFVDRARPVVLDWLPWSHTFGTNHNFNVVLRNGGSLYIDDGRPMPGLVERTVENAREVRPTLFFNVPRGYDALLPLLESDEAAARLFFSRLEMLFFAAAALPESTAARLRALASRHGNPALFFTTEWGSTETSPVITSAHFPCTDSRNIGVPVPGMELKFVPCQDKLELRARGPSIFPGYLGDPEKTAQAFDEDGFYRIGDAGKLADPADPNKGVLFDGRVAEDFKLTSGTWVSVGTLRVRTVTALAPYAQDVVVAGHDREEIGVLIFPAPAMQALAGADGALDGEGLMANGAVRAFVHDALARLCQGTGSSQRPVRAVILSSPPSLEHGEITDKGYINQRAVLERRADAVRLLYSDHETVIRLNLRHS